MSCLSCCKKVNKEVHSENHHSVTYKSDTQLEQMRLKLLDHISKYNNELGSPKIHIEGKVYCLSYDTLMAQENSPYLLKDIVINHYRNNILKVPEALENELEAVCNIVRMLKRSGIEA